MCLSGFMNSPTEPAFLALIHGMKYIMNHLNEPIMYSRENNFKVNEIPHQCFFKIGSAETTKNQEQSNFLHTYCDEYYALDIYDKRYVTSTSHLFNGTIIDWCAKKQSETPRSSSNTKIRAIHIGVLDQNWVIFLLINY